MPLLSTASPSLLTLSKMLQLTAEIAAAKARSSKLDLISAGKSFEH